MIVREVLKNPALIDNFDYFNDTADTVRWLKGYGTKEASELAEKLEAKDKAYWAAKRQSQRAV